MIRKTIDRAVRFRVLWDTRGQDLIEYALMAGFVAVTAGAVAPDISASISQIFYQVKKALESAKSTS